MMELGGNISLEGFEKLDYAELVVVKKIVGHYAKEFSNLNTSFSGLFISLSFDDLKKVSVKVTLGSEEITSETENHNLFIALDSALKEVKNKINK